MYTFKKVSQSQIPWKTIEGALDSTCLPWLKKQYHNTKRLIAKIVGKKSFK